MKGQEGRNFAAVYASLAAMLAIGFLVGVYSERRLERIRAAAHIAESADEYARLNLRCVEDGNETVCRWLRHASAR